MGLPLRGITAATDEGAIAVAITGQHLPASSVAPLLVIMMPADASVTRLGLVGELDLATAPTVCDAAGQLLRTRRPGDVLLDLSRLTFCDARGLSALMAVDRIVRDTGGRLRVTGASPRLRRLLALTDLDHDLGAQAEPVRR